MNKPTNTDRLNLYEKKEVRQITYETISNTVESMAESKERIRQSYELIEKTRSHLRQIELRKKEKSSNCKCGNSF